MTHLIGVDLGQAQDYTAWCAIRRREQARAIPSAPFGEADEGWLYPYYNCRLLERAPLHTPYPQIVEELQALIAHPEIGGPQREGPYALVVDMTRERAVYDYLVVSGLDPIGIVITSGRQSRESDEDGIYYVPTEELVQTFQLVVQHRPSRLTVSSTVAQARELAREMQQFRMKINRRSHTSYEAMRDEDHDDLLNCLMVPIWYAETVAGIRELDVPGGEEYNYADHDPLGRDR